MIIQYSNNPLVVTLDQDVSAFPSLVASLWDKEERLIKTWWKDDMELSGSKVILSITPEETAQLREKHCWLAVKGMDENGYTVFWTVVREDVLHRIDGEIPLTRQL